MLSSNPLLFLALVTLAALIPMGIGLVTSYVKVSIVIGMLRNALGAQQVPSNLIVMSLSLALTFYIMSPVVNESMKAIEPLDIQKVLKEQPLEALSDFGPALSPWRQFMEDHAGRRELTVLSSLHREGSAGEPSPDLSQKTLEAPEYRILVPAFLLTELKQACAMGFVILLPFLVIDLIVSNLLAGMGMYMVSPAMISLPIKLLLFVMADGWLLLSKALIMSYRL